MTYDVYGFEIKYPESWYAYRDTLFASKDTLGDTVISTFTQDKYEKYFGTDEHTKLGKNSGVITLSYSYSKTGSMEAWLESAKRNAERSCQVGMKCEKPIVEEVKVAGQKGYRIYMPYSEKQTMYEQGIYLTYVF